VCGILCFFCLGPVLGIPAVILGILGLSKAKQIGTGKGMSIAGIILGAVGTLLTIAFFVFVVIAAEDATDDLSGPADPGDYEIDIDQSSCEVDRFGFLTLTGTIQNTSGSEKNFTVNGSVRDADDGTILDSSGADIVSDIPAGQSAAWDITFSVADESATPECTVTVDNWFN
jgi:hypothetical protein